MISFIFNQKDSSRKKTTGKTVRTWNTCHIQVLQLSTYMSARRKEVPPELSGQINNSNGIDDSLMTTLGA